MATRPAWHSRMRHPCRTAAGVVLAIVCVAGALIVPGAGDAFAQRPPYRERPEGYNRDYDRGGRQKHSHEAGVFDYYLLALSWSPT